MPFSMIGLFEGNEIMTYQQQQYSQNKTHKPKSDLYRNLEAIRLVKEIVTLTSLSKGRDGMA